MRLKTNPTDFERLARENMDALYSKALRITHNAPNAENLVQSTYSRAYQIFPSFDESVAFQEWLFQILESFSREYGFAV